MNDQKSRIYLPVETPTAAGREREPEIRTELDRLEKSTLVLAERVEILTHRLSPMLRSEPTPDDKQELVSTNPRTPIGVNIRTSKERIDHSIANLRRVLDLLEL